MISGLFWTSTAHLDRKRPSMKFFNVMFSSWEIWIDSFEIMSVNLNWIGQVELEWQEQKFPELYFKDI